MNIDNITLGEMKQLQSIFNGGTKKTCSMEIGKCYFIRTVTLYYTGRLISITDSDFVLEDAAWIADTGRFSDALKTGDLNEVEPFPKNVIVDRGGIIDSCEWDHELPRAKK